MLTRAHFTIIYTLFARALIYSARDVNEMWYKRWRNDSYAMTHTAGLVRIGGFSSITWLWVDENRVVISQHPYVPLAACLAFLCLSLEMYVRIYAFSFMRQKNVMHTGCNLIILRSWSRVEQQFGFSCEQRVDLLYHNIYIHTHAKESEAVMHFRLHTNF